MSGHVRTLRFELLEARRVLAAVDIPDDLSGEVAEIVATPINIDNAAGVRAAEIRIQYDPTRLNVTEDDIQAGSVWAGSAEVVANVDADAGTIQVFVFAAQELGAGNGSLLNVNFAIRNNAAMGDVLTIDLAELSLNEGAIPLITTPQPGADGTDGRITVAGDATGDTSVSGFVYADVNVNNQPDGTEGIPGVTIVLVNAATNQQVAITTTGDNGRYSFTALTAGSYRIVEQQPGAYLEGGSNEISLTLAANQSVSNQNFRELGLRPEFVYNRLFTTVALPVGTTGWINTIRTIVDDSQPAASATTLTAETTSAERASANTGSAEGESPTPAGNGEDEPAPGLSGMAALGAEGEWAGSGAASRALAALTVPVVVPPPVATAPVRVVPVVVTSATPVERLDVTLSYNASALRGKLDAIAPGSGWQVGEVTSATTGGSTVVTATLQSSGAEVSLGHVLWLPLEVLDGTSSDARESLDSVRLLDVQSTDQVFEIVAHWRAESTDVAVGEMTSGAEPDDASLAWLGAAASLDELDELFASL
ncbi:MAG: cohesin domain-containing protein [Pirellulaceae bacterium]